MSSSKEEASSAPPVAATAAKPDASEADFLLFGSRPSHLFDDMRITLDTLLTEEVASLPLLPRTLTPSQRQQQHSGEKPLTGEQKLIAELRKAYKKKLDLAEAYCSRNIFTIQFYNKTKRRKIMERVLGEDDNDDGSSNNEDGGKDSDNNDKKKKAFSPLPAITFERPSGEIPSADEMNGKNKEILQARQQIQHDKQRRVQLSRQLDRLTKAAQQLKELRGALDKALERKKASGGTEGESSNTALAMKELQESVAKAVEGHEELKVWNARAEEVIQLMDQIKDEREEGGGLLGGSQNTNGSSKRVTSREEDERERKRMLTEMGGGETATHGTKEEIASLLNKIRS
uniref:Uncharacterized protein n=1 Tax=Skeletonema marinoi TaxID=267567 RepID=A0A7S2Q107_9STRA|mmetsp:Transcript_758/g.1211  ORF Transcript_758/g.1211 Transcript_758/m.1211 type:complete len:345 (+) Transcript_758:97-1131(+)